MILKTINYVLVVLDSLLLLFNLSLLCCGVILDVLSSLGGSFLTRFLLVFSLVVGHLFFFLLFFDDFERLISCELLLESSLLDYKLLDLLSASVDVACKVKRLVSHPLVE